MDDLYREQRLRASGVWERLTDAGEAALVRDQLIPTPALQRVREWLLGPAPAIGLFGPCDSGKTIAGAWALARLGGRYETLSLLETFLGRASAEAAAPGLLVIDNIGWELDEDRPALDAVLVEVLTARSTRERRTVLLGDRPGPTGPWVAHLRSVGPLVTVSATGLREKHRPGGGRLW